MSEKKYYAISDEYYDELRREREEHKKEILNFPVFYTEDGKKRYINVESVTSAGEPDCYFVYDDKTRLIEAHSFSGDITKYYFNDKKKKVTVMTCWAENGVWHKGTYDVFTDEETQKYGVWYGDRKERERKFREKILKEAQ